MHATVKAALYYSQVGKLRRPTEPTGKVNLDINNRILDDPLTESTHPNPKNSPSLYCVHAVRKVLFCRETKLLVSTLFPKPFINIPKEMGKKDRGKVVGRG